MFQRDTRFFACLCGVAIVVGWVMMLAAFASACKYDTPAQEAKAPAEGFPVDIEAQQQRAVRIMVLCRDSSKNASGSGVIFNKHMLITANHVVDRGCHSMRVFAVAHNARVFHMTISDTLPSHDLAMLVTGEAMPVPPVDLNGGVVRAGETVCVVPGFPKRVRTCGKTLVVFKRPGEKNLYFEAHTESGNSGGGIYNTRGDIVGIATHSLSEGSKPKGGAGTALWLMDPDLK